MAWGYWTLYCNWIMLSLQRFSADCFEMYHYVPPAFSFLIICMTWLIWYHVKNVNSHLYVWHLKFIMDNREPGQHQHRVRVGSWLNIVWLWHFHFWEYAWIGSFDFMLGMRTLPPKPVHWKVMCMYTCMWHITTSDPEQYIWTSADFTPEQRAATVISILKPNKDHTDQLRPMRQPNNRTISEICTWLASVADCLYWVKVSHGPPN